MCAFFLLSFSSVQIEGKRKSTWQARRQNDKKQGQNLKEDNNKNVACVHIKKVYYLLVIHMQIHKYMHRAFTPQLVQNKCSKSSKIDL